MTPKRLVSVIWLLVAIVLAACSAAEPEPATVEVTRIVTETVIQEGETVEVTRILVEPVITQPEVVEAPAQDVAESIGSEHAAGAQPAPPDEGPKVEEERIVVEAAEPLAEAPRAGTPMPSATLTAPAVDTARGETIPTGLTLDQNSRLTAGEVDDNDRWDDYLLYLRDYSGAAVVRVDVSERHQIWVTDSTGHPVPAASVRIEANGQEVTTLRTHSDGRVYFFPRAYPVAAETYSVNVILNGVTETFTIPAGSSQREWNVTHQGADQTPDMNRLDILFLIDATGSMADEINQLKGNIHAIAAQIDTLPAQPDVRFGMVTYRDRSDEYVARVTDFTPDVNVFARALAQVEAAGGGDYPEDLNEALSQAVHMPEWRVDGTVSLIFLVADAPPHLDYGQTNDYAVEMAQAARRGIKIYPIASSGLDSQGEYIFRQLAQFTGGRFIFLTYGAGGPGTTGTETDFAVSDYTVSSLDALVVKIVEEELAYLAR